MSPLRRGHFGNSYRGGKAVDLETGRAGRHQDHNAERSDIKGVLECVFKPLAALLKTNLRSSLMFTTTFLATQRMRTDGIRPRCNVSSLSNIKGAVCVDEAKHMESSHCNWSTRRASKSDERPHERSQVYNWTAWSNRTSRIARSSCMLIWEITFLHFPSFSPFLQGPPGNMGDVGQIGVAGVPGLEGPQGSFCIAQICVELTIYYF